LHHLTPRAMIAPSWCPPRIFRAPMVGELAALGAALIWSVSMSIFAVQGQGLPAPALNLFKNLVALVCFIVAWLVMRPGMPEVSVNLGLLAISGVVGLSLGDTALFAALQRLGANVTSASQCLAPPIAALIAMLVLGESLTILETLGLFITVVAVAGVIHYGRREGAPLAGLAKRTLVIGILFAVFSATCQGVGLVISRFAMQSVDVLSGTIVRIAPALVVLLTMTLSGSTVATLRTTQMSRQRAAWLLFAAFCGTFLGLLFMSIGVKYAKAGVAAALTSTYPIWIIPISRFVLKKPVNGPTIACTLAAVAGIVLMLCGGQS
jgi:drug/metabolite transporter (DMT)-like permease